MDKKYFLIIFLSIFGFILSIIASIVAAVSFKTLLIRALTSALVMGIIGVLFVFIDNKYGNQNSTSQGINDNIDYKDIFNKGEETESFNEEHVTEGELEEDNYDEEKVAEDFDIVEGKVDEEVLEKDFEKNIENENVEKENKKNNAVKLENNEKSDRISEDFSNESQDVLSDLEKEVKSKTKEVNLDSNIKIGENIVKDNDIDTEKLSQEKDSISTYSSEAVVSGGIESVDKDYIYFDKNKKIENNPEKIAKVIKGLLHEENKS